MTRRRPPKLPTDTMHGESLEPIIDRVLLASKKIQTLTKKVLRHERLLRRLVDDEAWRAYLRLEAVMNERVIEEQDALIKWALAYGARCPS